MYSIQQIKNIILCKRHSFAIVSCTKNNSILSPGSLFRVSGNIRNNGLRIGTVYLIVLLADPYDHTNIIFNTDRDFGESQKQAMRYVDIAPGSIRSFSCNIILPANLKRGVLDIKLELWTPDKLFKEALAKHNAYRFYKTKWRGMLEVVESQSNNIKVFISYAWFSNEHKDWVRQLSEELLRHKILSVLDQNDIYPGDNIISFMEAAVTDHAICIAVCSDSYTDKANKKTGYVWHEVELLMEHSFRNDKKFTIIPIIRNNPQKIIPNCFGMLAYVDMDNEEWQAVPLSQLVAAIHRKISK